MTDQRHVARRPLTSDAPTTIAGGATLAGGKNGVKVIAGGRFLRNNGLVVATHPFAASATALRAPGPALGLRVAVWKLGWRPLR